MFDPGNAGYDVFESPIFQIFPGEHAPGPPYIIRGVGADSLFVSPVTWCLTFSYKNNLHTYGKQMTIPSLDEVEVLNAEETIQNETKLPLRKSLSQ